MTWPKMHPNSLSTHRAMILDGQTMNRQLIVLLTLVPV